MHLIVETKVQKAYAKHAMKKEAANGIEPL
jgi:hypothetical protein